MTDVEKATERAATVLAHYQSTLGGPSYREEPETVLSDILADLMHLAVRDGVDFDAVADTARGHFAAETREA